MTGVGTGYALRVAGHLDDHWAERLGGLGLTRNPDGTTTLSGAVRDQAQLHGLLSGLRDIGATLLSLHEREPDRIAPVLERTLRTARLTIRPATERDADATWAFRRLASVNRWLTGTPADVEGYRALFGDPARLATTVVVELDADSGRHLVGDLMLRREDGWAQIDVADRARGVQAELGWVLDPAYAGRGYATEAVRELLRYCFEEAGVRRVVATCFLDNIASWRLMERVGMRRETHAVRDSLHRCDGWLDTVGYALLAEEWSELDGPAASR